MPGLRLIPMKLNIKKLTDKEIFKHSKKSNSGNPKIDYFGNSFTNLTTI